MATKLEYFDLLNVIYDQIIEISRHNHQMINPNHYIAKIKLNQQQCQHFSQFNSAVAIINYELFSSNFSEKNDTLLKSLDEVKNKLESDLSHFQSAKMQLKVHSCVKQTLLQQKDFKTLESYLIYSLEDFEEKKLFNSDNHKEKIVMLSWIINTLTKNLNFNKALYYSEQLYKSLFEHHKLLYNSYIWTYYQGLVINYSFLGRIDEVIDLLNDLRNSKQFKGIPFYDIFVFLNLTTHYYCKNDINNALKNLALINATDTYKTLSENWKISFSIVELILHIENKDYEYVLNKTQAFRRYFQDALKKEVYQREKHFISILRYLAQIPKPYKDTKVIEKINAFIDNSPPFEPGSNEAINYSIWLQSKIEKKSYYQLILNVVSKDTLQN